MYYKVKITQNPKAKNGMQVQGSLYNDSTPFNGFNLQKGKKNLIESKYIKAVPKEEANLEAEGGETVYGDLNGDTFPEHKIIKGPRHSKGGVPLKLPDDSFIFSDTNSMKINDPNILQMFNQTEKKVKGLTPATLAKQYDIDSYRKILQDPNSDKIARRTAELMMRNYNMKLGALALAQESKKGFPQGIPEMAKPYMEYAGIDEKQLLPPTLPTPQAPQNMQMQQPSPEDMAMMQQGQGDGEEDPMMQQGQEEMMRWGGIRRLRRAQQGMQQASQEEMMMQQQGQGQDPMQQLMQQVGQALQGGANPEEVAAQLIQSQVPPEQVAQIFVQLGMPEEQVQQLIGAVMQQMQGGQEQQMDPRQQQQLSEEEMMAMQQQDPQQMQEAPMAMYGMQMGGYDMPFNQYAYGGSPSYYSRGGDIPKYGPGGEPPKGQIVKRSDYADDAAYNIALRKAKLRADKSGESIYTLKPDGTYVQMKVSDKQDAAYTGDMKGWSGKSEVAAKYAAMDAALKDPQTAKLFADATRKALLDKEKYRSKNKLDARGNEIANSGTLGATYEARGLGNVANLSDKEIVDNYLEHQKRNLQLSASGNESYLYNDADGKLRKEHGTGKRDNLGFTELMQGMKKPDGSRMYTDAEIKAKYKDMSANAPTLDKAFENLGIPMPARAKGSAAEKKALLQQATFQGYDQLMKDVASGKITNEDELVRLMNFRGNLQRGYQDESGQGVIDISPIDAYYTNTTAGQISSYGDYQFDEIPPGPKPGPCQCETDKLPDGSPDPSFKPKDKDGKCTCDPEEPKKCPCGYDPVTKECLPCDIIPPEETPPQWWLQDTIKTAGAASDLMGIKKYMPWAPKIDLEEPRPTFLDPTRELAQQSEQANMAIQGLSQFAGPQGLSARASSIQGTGAKQAADTLSKYNNANVNLADQFEFKSVDIRNQEAIGNQAAQSKLYDQNTIANQQYDNSKLALKNNLRNQYTNAITNKTKTEALNKLYPQYSISPATGGRPNFNYGKNIKPEVTKSQQDYYDEIIANDPDIDKKLAWDMAKTKAGTQTSDDNKLDLIEEQYKLKKYGGNMKNGGFIYTTTFPWLL